MIISRPGLIGLLLLLAGSGAGCTSTAAERPSDHRPAEVAVPSYAATDSPGYCAALAESTHLTRIPAAVGLLAGGSAEAEPRFELTEAIDELQTVLGQVEDAGGWPRLEAVIANLSEALTTAKEPGGVTRVHDGVREGLDELGRIVQPVCGFPS
ncbi:UNVERIFIED_ORG: hypothetical protein E4P37_00380 [Bacillus sp. AZ43]